MGQSTYDLSGIARWLRTRTMEEVFKLDSLGPPPPFLLASSGGHQAAWDGIPVLQPFGERTAYRMAVEMHSQQLDTQTLSAGSFVLPEAGGYPLRRYALTEASPERRFSYRVVKRSLDIALILLASPILLPLFAVIALAIRISTPGPVFFSHRRIRRHGEFFTMWKFRTMCVNSAEVLEEYLNAHPEARAEWRKSHKLKDDPRVTRIGRFLRRTSLDELPQLWNVFTGSMTMVGPRPIVAAEVEKYGDYFADYCMVKPGITGLWQVSGRSRTTYPERVQLDRQYARHWSLTGDVLILLRTFSSVLNQEGAF